MSGLAPDGDAEQSSTTLLTMRIVHTVGSIEGEAAGPSYSVPRLCRSLAALGDEVVLFSLGDAPYEGQMAYRDVRFRRDLDWLGPLRKLGASGAMRRAIESCEADAFHTHGLWTLPNIYAAWAAHGRTRPFMLSPRGMLAKSALQFSGLRKRAFWALAQGRAMRRVACFHATADQEYEDIRDFGLKQPIAVIPNGIDLPPSLAGRLDQSDVASPFVLSLGRIHPIKALDRLIRAWSLIETDFPSWQLKIIGPSEVGHAEELKHLARQLKLNTVEIAGPVFGNQKIALLTQADVFALSSLNENFGMTVAESLACCTPVISTKGAPWAGLETHGCGWWIDHGIEPLAAALRTAMSLSPEERRAMGQRGRAWMQRDFSWDGIARQMAEVYRWLAEGGDRPSCVVMD